MRCPIVLALFGAWTAQVPGSQAAEPEHLQAGLYEIEVRLELPHVGDTNTRKTVTLCLSPAHASGIYGFKVLSDVNPLETCPVADRRQEGDLLTFQIVCRGVNEARATATFLLAGHAFNGRISMQLGAKNMTMAEIQAGHRIGPCEAETAPSN